MTDRFKLEEDIMGCWQVVDDLRVVRESAEEGRVPVNQLEALETLYQLKFERLFVTFETLVAEKKL